MVEVVFQLSKGLAEGEQSDRALQGAVAMTPSTTRRRNAGLRRRESLSSSEPWKAGQEEGAFRVQLFYEQGAIFGQEGQARWVVGRGRSNAQSYCRQVQSRQRNEAVTRTVTYRSGGGRDRESRGIASSLNGRKKALQNWIIADKINLFRKHELE